MSEYQFVAFRAIDGPISAKNMEYMQLQSSHAKVSPWLFENEYHYGDFRGNAAEMLRRGYDIHLDYANYGIRTLMIRLPSGLPNPAAAKPYLGKGFVQYKADSKQPGGILVVNPMHESGDLDLLFDVTDLIDRLIPLRAELLDGDLRPLYLAHLAMALDMEHDPETTIEGPVPAGLDQLTYAQQGLAYYLGIDRSFLAGAACRAPKLPAGKVALAQELEWLKTLPVSVKDAWLARLLAEPTSAVRAEMFTEFRKSHPSEAWPTVNLKRTMVEIQNAADELDKQADRERKLKAASERAARVEARKVNPTKTLAEVDELAAKRTIVAYEAATEMLSELKEALQDTPQADLPYKQAMLLRKQYPKAFTLTKALREAGLLPK